MISLKAFAVLPFVETQHSSSLYHPRLLGMHQASGEVFTPQSPWQEQAGTAEMTVPGLGDVTADRHGVLASTQCVRPQG